MSSIGDFYQYMGRAWHVIREDMEGSKLPDLHLCHEKDADEYALFDREDGGFFMLIPASLVAADDADLDLLALQQDLEIDEAYKRGRAMGVTETQRQIQQLLGTDRIATALETVAEYLGEHWS